MSNRSFSKRESSARRRQSPGIENLGAASNELADESRGPPLELGRTVGTAPTLDQTKPLRDGKMKEEQTNTTGSTVLLLTCFLGIFCSYLVYGLLQESM